MEPSGLRCRQWKLRITGIKGRRIRRSPLRQRWQIDDFLPTQSTSAQDCILGISSCSCGTARWRTPTQDSRVCVRTGRETAGPSTTLPRISCRTWWRWRTSCGFLYGKPHTRPCPVPRGRKSGFAPVPRQAGAGGMTKWKAAAHLSSGWRGMDRVNQQDPLAEHQPDG